MCHAKVIFEDSDDGSAFSLQNDNLTIARNAIAFSSHVLTSNRKYNVIVSASSIHGNVTSYTFISMLATHAYT